MDESSAAMLGGRQPEFVPMVEVNSVKDLHEQVIPGAEKFRDLLGVRKLLLETQRPETIFPEAAQGLRLLGIEIVPIYKLRYEDFPSGLWDYKGWMTWGKYIRKGNEVTDATEYGFDFEQMNHRLVYGQDLDTLRLKRQQLETLMRFCQEDMPTFVYPGIISGEKERSDREAVIAGCAMRVFTGVQFTWHGWFEFNEYEDQARVGEMWTRAGIRTAALVECTYESEAATMINDPNPRYWLPREIPVVYMKISGNCRQVQRVVVYSGLWRFKDVATYIRAGLDRLVGWIPAGLPPRVS